ncbi:MAG: hypothetical protein ACREJM_01925, partial [Candidatus Saccharimonadales bacterium]
PLPTHDFRNGSLNQLAYSLFLFIRDIAQNDLVGWIDARLAEAKLGREDGRIARMITAIIDPLTSVHGASNKVLSMTFADLLIVAKDHDPTWGEVGAGLIAVDTLVHNFLVRTGILTRANAAHAYGPTCYGSTGCAALIARISKAIDARQFNDAFPKYFPRYVQSAIWRYCAAEGRNVCNGTRINDTRPCQNRDCRLYCGCDRVKLGRQQAKTSI